MGRTPCCSKEGLKKGPWTPEEDQKLVDYITLHGHTNWRALPKKCGLLRCGKSCRLRWTNYLKPDIKRGKFSYFEEQTIIRLHGIVGNKWAFIASQLPKRTDNEIKNYWNTVLRKRFRRLNLMNMDGVRQKAIDNSTTFSTSDTNLSISMSSGHLAQWENVRLQAEARLVIESEMRAKGKWRQLTLQQYPVSNASDPCLSLPRSDTSSLMQPDHQSLLAILASLVRSSRQDHITQLLTAALLKPIISGSNLSSKSGGDVGSTKLSWCPSEDSNNSVKPADPDEGIDSTPSSANDDTLTNMIHLLNGRPENIDQHATSTESGIPAMLDKPILSGIEEEMISLELDEGGHCRSFKEWQDLLLEDDNGSCLSPPSPTRWQQCNLNHDPTNDACNAEANIVGEASSPATKIGLEPIALVELDISELDIYGCCHESPRFSQEVNYGVNGALISHANQIDKASNSDRDILSESHSVGDVNLVHWNNLLMQLFDPTSCAPNSG